MTILSNAICRFNVILSKLPMAFFTKQYQKISQFIWKHKRPQITKAVLRKKNGAGGINLPDFTSLKIQFSSVQLLSHVQLCDPMNHSTPGLTVHHQLPEFTQTHVHRVSDVIEPSHPLLSLSLPALNPSQHQSFPRELTFRMKWPKYWSFSFSRTYSLIVY